jgi:uncharacterized protein (UPF0264 family)
MTKVPVQSLPGGQPGPPAKVRLLVSVRNLSEAWAAIDGGADWIDLKEPRAGALGAVDPNTVRRVVGALGGKRPLSAAAGEMRDLWRDGRLLWEPVDVPAIIKVGLAGCGRLSDWQLQWQQLHEFLAARGQKMVAVAYADASWADAPRVADVIQQAVQSHCPYLLIDTYGKRGTSTPSAGHLLHFLASAKLADHLATAREAGLQSVIAGGLTAAELPHLPWRWIDVIGIRGAATSGSRTSRVTSAKVAGFRAALDRVSGRDSLTPLSGRRY